MDQEFKIEVSKQQLKTLYTKKHDTKESILSLESKENYYKEKLNERSSKISKINESIKSRNDQNSTDTSQNFLFTLNQKIYDFFCLEKKIKMNELMSLALEKFPNSQILDLTQIISIIEKKATNNNNQNENLVSILENKTKKNLFLLSKEEGNNNHKKIKKIFKKIEAANHDYFEYKFNKARIKIEIEEKTKKIHQILQKLSNKNLYVPTDDIKQICDFPELYFNNLNFVLNDELLKKFYEIIEKEKASNRENEEEYANLCQLFKNLKELLKQFSENKEVCKETQKKLTNNIQGESVSDKKEPLKSANRDINQNDSLTKKNVYLRLAEFIGNPIEKIKAGMQVEKKELEKQKEEMLIEMKKKGNFILKPLYELENELARNKIKVYYLEKKISRLMKEKTKQKEELNSIKKLYRKEKKNIFNLYRVILKKK